MIYLAKFISIVLGPITLWPIILLILLWRTNLTLFPVLFLLQAIIPLTFVLLAFKDKRISDLDLSRRRERYLPILITLICFIVSLPFIYIFGNPSLVYLFKLLIFLIIINGLITLFWKISFHMALNIVFALLVNYLFRWTLPVLYLTIPLVFWSRLKLKKHSPAQLIGSLILNGIITILFLRHVPGL